MQTPNQTLGAYFQCHKNAASFARTIKSFRQHYSTGDIVVVNDGGYNYQPFCAKYNVHYTYKPKMATLRNALIFSSYDNCVGFLKNLYESLVHIKDTHIVLLEDDVRIVRPHTRPFDFTISGCNKNEFLHVSMQTILKNKGYTGEFFYGACGGCVLDRAFLQAIPFADIEALIYQIKDYPQAFASDMLLSFIVLYFGGTIGQHEEFAEVWYKDIYERMSTNRVAFLHQYKNDYETRGVFPNDEELAELEDYV